MRVLRTSVRRKRPRVIQPFPVLQPVRWRNWKKSAHSELPASSSGSRQVASTTLIVLGGVLCLFVAASYAGMYLEQKRLLHAFKTNQTAAEALTELSIPKIGLRAVIIEGTASSSLLRGPGHMTGSALAGTPGNSVIAGHRDTFFRNLHRLKLGDVIYVLRGGKRFRYVVAERKVVAAGDISVLHATKDKEITLITCYPAHFIGPSPQRLVFVAKSGS